MPSTKNRVSPWEAARPRPPADIPTWEELDQLPDVRLLAPSRPADPLMADYRALA